MSFVKKKKIIMENGKENYIYIYTYIFKISDAV